MVCDECKKAGQKSFVYPGASSGSLLYCKPFYDQDGKLHDHDSNTSSTSYSCSNGHHWTVASGPRKCWCGWPEQADRKPDTVASSS